MTLAARLRAGETMVCGWSAIADAFVAEAIALSGFDAVLLDMQHGGHDEASVLAGSALIAAAGVAPLTRIPVGRFDMASRALDFGAAAVVAPMINSRTDAEAFASAMKYPPVGGRSWGPMRPRVLQRDFNTDTYLASANDDTAALAMIETREALAALDEILDVDGIDGVFFGPGDFSIAWSGGKTVDPDLADMMPAVAEIAGKARQRGKAAGLYLNDPRQADRYHDMGYSLFAIGVEQRYMNEGAGNIIAAVRKALG
ncbi:MAG: aldolase/citrate lyase family protein [Rhizobiaceae bacterium]